MVRHLCLRSPSYRLKQIWGSMVLGLLCSAGGPQNGRFLARKNRSNLLSSLRFDADTDPGNFELEAACYVLKAFFNTCTSKKKVPRPRACRVSQQIL